MIQTLSSPIKEFNKLKKHPKKIEYIGNINLLYKRKISIVGSRSPNAYTKLYTHQLANELSKRGICIVSGLAMGVDTLAHKGAKSSNTIAVVANGLNIKYPKINTKLIDDIEENGLILSQFASNESAKPYTFVQRNELVVALGECLIITQADLNSGTLRSAQFALKQNKQIFVLPHRINESLGTQELLKNNQAKAIYNLEDFLNQFGEITIQNNDEVLEFIKKDNLYESAYERFGNKLFEYELEGKITINNGHISVV